jgi:hypothetical protein
MAPLGVIGQLVVLPGEITIQRVQGSPQRSRRRDGLSMTLFALKMMHHRSDTPDDALGVLDFAIPQPLAQKVDHLDDHRLRRHWCRAICRQTAGDLLQVLQPHGDVEPVKDRRLGDASLGENASEA